MGTLALGRTNATQQSHWRPESRSDPQEAGGVELERRNHNPLVGGSSPSLATRNINGLPRAGHFFIIGGVTPGLHGHFVLKPRNISATRSKRSACSAQKNAPTRVTGRTRPRAHTDRLPLPATK